MHLLVSILLIIEGVSLDGLSGVTLTDIKDNIMEKVYEHEGVLRHERRINALIPIETIFAFLRGGFPEHDFENRFSEIEDLLQDLLIAHKYAIATQDRVAEFLELIVKGMK